MFSITHKKILRVVGVFFVLLAAAALVGLGYVLPRRSITAQPDEVVVATPALDTTLAQGGQLAAVIIDGFIAAKPQSGLDRSPLVFEFPAEAAIPRYLTFVPVKTDLADETTWGPIRSLRPYFFDVARGFGATLAHVGGSPAALDQVRRTETSTLNQYFLMDYFYRSASRQAPHNVYTTSRRLQQASDEGRMTKDTHEPAWARLAENGITGDNDKRASVISINHFEPSYSVRWHYETDAEEYRRQQGGKNHVMSDGATVAVNNVIVLWTDVKILDSIGRREIRTVGEGTMKLFRNGLVFDGRWQREDDQPFQFFDTEGKALELAREKIWVHVLPVGYPVIDK